MTITLYSTSSPAKMVSKTLTGATNYTGSFRQGEHPSDRDPVVVISTARSSLTAYNYAYIPAFGAYYFIKDKVAVSAGTTEIVMHKDVLMTYSAGIRANRALINRQESINIGDVNLDDSAYVVKRNELETMTFSNYGNHSASIVLGVTGTM